MSTGTEKRAREEAVFANSLQTLTLTELQDVYSHLDRDAYPERIHEVRDQIQIRLGQLDAASTALAEPTISAGAFRRLWGSLLDVFVSLFPVVIYLGGKLLAVSSGASGSGGSRGRSGRPGGGRGGAAESSFLDQVTDYITSPEAIWVTVETYGPWILGFMVYRALFVLPQLKRSGVLPGMKEAGVRLVSSNGSDLAWKQLSVRFLLSYVLGFLTLGISHLWVLWDAQSRTVFDRLSGTRTLRASRHWEKLPEDQL